jgi:hypothetical protein
MVPAILDFYGDRTDVIVPATARVGEPVTVVVQTFGGPVELASRQVVCIGMGRTEVVLQGLTLEVKPFDIENRPAAGLACVDMRVLLRHEARVVFAEPGTATVRVSGRRFPTDQAITFTREVIVRP